MGKWDNFQTKLLGPRAEPQNGNTNEQRQTTNFAQISAEAAFSNDQNRRGLFGKKKPNRSEEVDSGGAKAGGKQAENAQIKRNQSRQTALRETKIEETQSRAKNLEDSKLGETQAEETNSKEASPRNVGEPKRTETGSPPTAARPSSRGQQIPQRKPVPNHGNQDAPPALPPGNEQRQLKKKNGQQFKPNAPLPQPEGIENQPQPAKDSRETNSRGEHLNQKIDASGKIRLQKEFDSELPAIRKTDPINLDDFLVPGLSEPENQNLNEDIHRFDEGVERISRYLEPTEDPDNGLERNIPRPLPGDIEALQSLTQAYQTAFLAKLDVEKKMQNMADTMKNLATDRERAKKEFENFKIQQSQSYDEKLRQEKRDIEIEHEKTIARLTEEHGKHVSNMQKERGDLEVKYDDNISRLNEVHDEKISNLQKENQDLEIEHQNNIARLAELHNEKVSDQQKETRDLKFEHEGDVARLIKVHEDNISNLRREKDQEIWLFKGKVEVLTTIRNGHESHIKTIRRDHDSEISELRKTHESELQDLKDKQFNENKSWDQRLNERSNLDAENLSRVKTKLESQLKNLENQLADANASIQANADAYELQLETLRAEHIEEKERMDETFSNRQALLTIEHENEKQVLDQRLSQGQEDLEVEKTAKAMALAALRSEMNQNFDRERTRWNTERHSEKVKLVEQLEAKSEELRKERIMRMQDTTALENKYQNRITELVAEHNKDVGALRDNHGIKISALATSYKTQIDAYETRISNLIATHSKEIDSLKATHSRERDSLKSTHKKELVERHKNLQLEIQNLKTDIVKKRDYFKAIGDHEFGERFQDISVDVEDLARLEWVKGPGLRWPFPDHLLRACENQRRAKQYILQNTLWVILYDRIFCTPFRVLGKEGLSLEYEWAEKFGNDRKATGSLAMCPKATPNSEKWRYQTIKPYLEAATQPLMEDDSNYKVKESYDLLLRDTTEDIANELGKVLRVGSGEKQDINNLVRKATKLWFDAARQRCRVFLIMSSSDSKPVKSRPESLGSNNAMNVVVKPELRRLGNAQGERLEKEELISDCKGEFDVLSLG